MPIVTIQVTGKPVTRKQKQALIEESTRMLDDVLGKEPEKTWVLIVEVPAENWGVAGRSADAVLGRTG
jgi:4-oxalocrotonate tautomerase